MPDKDAVDSEIRCPELAGPKALKGCPDSGNDSFDLDDKMSNNVDKAGCIVDSDNDGVMDDMDRCPDVAGLLALKDFVRSSDGDGI
jgi:hypothetical protein